MFLASSVPLRFLGRAWRNDGRTAREQNVNEHITALIVHPWLIIAVETRVFLRFKGLSSVCTFPFSGNIKKPLWSEDIKPTLILFKHQLRCKSYEDIMSRWKLSKALLKRYIAYISHELTCQWMCIAFGRDQSSNTNATNDEWSSLFQGWDIFSHIFVVSANRLVVKLWCSMAM